MPADRRERGSVGGWLVVERVVDRFPVVPLPPRLAEYQQLRQSAGLPARTDAQAVRALRGSWAACQVPAPVGAPVAMGRVIGDGGWHFTVADVVTHPDYRKAQLADRVLGWLLKQIAVRAPADPFVTALTDPGGRKLYERAGFQVLARRGPAVQMVFEQP